MCRSTLAAEAVAADSATDRVAFTSLSLAEFINGVPAHKQSSPLKTLLVVDAKSLYDSIVKENVSLTDKHSMVNIRSIQEEITPRTVHWIPTTLMAADGLTKASKPLRQQLLQWIQEPIVQLRKES